VPAVSHEFKTRLEKLPGNYKDLFVWKKAMALVTEIYRPSKELTNAISRRK
jgi:hypothetical protein